MEIIVEKTSPKFKFHVKRVFFLAFLVEGVIHAADSSQRQYVGQLSAMKVQKSDHPHSWDPCVNYCHSQHPAHLAVVCTNFSPASTTTSGMTSQSSSTLPRTPHPMSPRNSMLKRRQRKKEHKSSYIFPSLCTDF
ncbi:hypothetical protein QTP70_001110 [Hemibagrus guttatus]|uniref:Uncharacterized protein n=1 Tax=Hemibagrus guttatus TaxID=175788 RepID=A0AAE0Q1T4_9TELE|nr:hypothetical protein QTP70_001110 [Hemibagrus guttatus]